MVRPSPIYPIGFRHSPQTRNPYGTRKRLLRRLTRKVQHLREFVQSEKRDLVGAWRSRVELGDFAKVAVEGLTVLCQNFYFANFKI